MNKPDDSELIALYHEGKLDGESMNRLERRALDDPFLADALDGFSQVKKPYIQVKRDLRERLEKRLHKQKRRSIIGQSAAWGAAAAIVLAIGATWFWFHEERTTESVIAAAPAPAVQPAPPEALPDSILKEGEQLSAIASAGKTQVKKAPPAAAAPVLARMQATSTDEEAPAALPDSIRLGEVAVVGYGTQQKSDITGSVAKVQVDSLRSRPAEQALQGRVAGVQIGKTVGKPAQIVHGQVISANDRMPIAGASVQILGTEKGTVTDAQGNFAIEAGKKAKLGVLYVGYEKKEVQPVPGDSLLIAMQPDNSNLNEVVVAGYGKGINQDAAPAGGWPEYRRYLEEKAVRPDGSRGSVVLEFSVSGDQTIQDISVVRAYSDQAAAQAQDILKKGPKWSPGTGTRINERVRITIRFR